MRLQAPAGGPWEARAVPTPSRRSPRSLAAIEGDDAIAARTCYGPVRSKTSVTGKVILGPDGEPLADTTAIQSAIMVLPKLRQQKMDLFGLRPRSK